MIVKTKSDLETISFGEKLGKLFKNIHGVILLEGNLAAGKTTLTKGIAKGLNINDIIKSPTFTIMKEYVGTNKLYHLDLYRLNDLGYDFDLLDYIDDFSSLVVIEWPNQVKELLPSEYLLIEIESNNENREFKITPFGSYYEEVLKKL